MTTVAAIQTIADRVLNADAESANAKTEYMRSLVGDVQTELGGTPRLRSGRAAKLTQDEKGAHLKAVAAVNERYYTVVVERAKTHAAGPGKALQLNGLTNWARTIVRDVRSYVRAGNDIRALAASKLTRQQLRVKVVPRPPTPATLRRRMEDRGKDFMSAALELIDNDPLAARAELELVMAQLATQLLNLGGKPTRNAQEAADTHKPFRIKSTVFVPTDTMVARSVASPS